MAAGNSVAPVIIKRKKVSGGDGHHGGAWKVAYADFVTAMMAFFLLMWLLNATTEKQRKGIADYFNPTIPINRISGGGNGAFGGTSIYAENTLSRSGTGSSGDRPPWVVEETSANSQGAGQAEAKELLKEVNATLVGSGGESELMENDLKHVVSRVTDEGIVIELFDIPGSALFARDGRTTHVADKLISRIATIANQTDKRIAVVSHSNTQPVVRKDFDPWRTTTLRSLTVSDRLEFSGVNHARIARLTGKADTEHADPDPLAVRNNRVEIIFLIAS